MLPFSLKSLKLPILSFTNSTGEFQEFLKEACLSFSVGLCFFLVLVLVWLLLFLFSVAFH